MITAADSALANLASQRATLGSAMNTLAFVADNQANELANTEASRSRVLDTDYAAATTELARTQIIQQAGTAMLAQANQLPQSVLALLQ
jgi:flagellin